MRDTLTNPLAIKRLHEWAVNPYSKVTISMGEYVRLLCNSKELSALEQAGVDNWHGYDIAMRELYEEDDK